MSGGLVALRRPDRERAIPLEREAPGEERFDYVLAPYTAPASPVGKLRSVNVLFESFALAGVEQRGRALVDRIRSTLGRGRTVWGIKKHASGELGWELYFYDWERRHADLSVASLRALFAPEVRVVAEEPFPLPWHMISVEVGHAQLVSGADAAVDVYIDMRSYALRGRALELANVYTFHDPRTEIDQVLQRMRSSVHFDWKRDSLAALLPPWMFRCHKLCVANKRRADALYAARVTTTALERFLARHRWPAELGALVRANAAELDHLCWDVGVDFARTSEGVVETGKTGIYGYF